VAEEEREDGRNDEREGGLRSFAAVVVVVEEVEEVEEEEIVERMDWFVDFFFREFFILPEAGLIAGRARRCD